MTMVLSDETIIRIFRERDLGIINEVADGDCLFRAVARQLTLHGRQSFTHQQIRAASCAFIEQNPTMFEGFLEIVEYDRIHREYVSRGASVSEYVEYMRQRGRYASHPDFTALRHCFGIDFLVYTIGDDRNLIETRVDHDDDVPNAEQTIRVFHKNPDDEGECHYESVVDLDEVPDALVIEVDEQPAYRRRERKPLRSVYTEAQEEADRKTKISAGNKRKGNDNSNNNNITNVGRTEKLGTLRSAAQRKQQESLEKQHEAALKKQQAARMKNQETEESLEEVNNQLQELVCYDDVDLCQEEYHGIAKRAGVYESCRDGSVNTKELANNPYKLPPEEGFAKQSVPLNAKQIGQKIYQSGKRGSDPKYVGHTMGAQGRKKNKRDKNVDKGWSELKAEHYEDQERDGRGLAGRNEEMAIKPEVKIPKLAFTKKGIGIKLLDAEGEVVSKDDYRKKGGNKKVRKFTVPNTDSCFELGKKMGYEKKNRGDTLRATNCALTKKEKHFRFSMEREDEHGILDRSVGPRDPRRQTAQYTFTHEKEGKDDQFFAPWEDLDISEESDEDDEESDEDSDESNGEDDDES